MTPRSISSSRQAKYCAAHRVEQPIQNDLPNIHDYPPNQRLNPDQDHARFIRQHRGEVDTSGELVTTIEGIGSLRNRCVA